jgi:Rod binding domain-containing protein
MTATSSLNPASLAPLTRPQALPMPKPICAKPTAAEQAEKLHDTFTKFVGQTFYGQMIKSMRSTVSQAAYFNGGQAEKMFQGQLDQTLAEQMTKATADRFAEPLFQRQFPHAAAQIANTSAGNQTSGLNDLSALSRR